MYIYLPVSLSWPTHNQHIAFSIYDRFVWIPTQVLSTSYMFKTRTTHSERNNDYNDNITYMI